MHSLKINERFSVAGMALGLFTSTLAGAPAAAQAPVDTQRIDTQVPESQAAESRSLGSQPLGNPYPGSPYPGSPYPAAYPGDAGPPAGNAAVARSSELNFGITIQATFSDNFMLAPQAAEASGRSLEVGPYLDGYLRTAKSRGDMALRLRGLWHSTGGTSESDLSPDVRANGDLALVDDSLRLAGSAYVFRTSASPFAATSVDPASRPADTQIYRAYVLSPYSLGRVGSADYELRYRGQVIDPGSAGIEATAQQVAAGLASGRRSASMLGWSTRAETERTNFEGLSDLQRSTAEALVYYGVTSLLRLGIGVNYSKIDALVEADGDNSGFGPTAFFSWKAGPRTHMLGKYADTYYGSESSLRLTHRGARWVFGLNYMKGLQTGTGSGLLYFDPNAIFELPDSAADDGGAMVRGLAERRVFGGAGQALLFGQTGSPLVIDESLIASIAFLRPRNSFLLTVFSNEQQPRASTISGEIATDLTQHGISLTFNHRLRPTSSLFLALEYLTSDSDQTRQEARLASATGGWRVALSRGTTFTAALRGSRQRSEGEVSSAEYVERAVIASIDYRF